MSGTLLYEFPPANPNCLGLNFTNVQQRPIRQATVQLVDATTNAVIASVVSDDTGLYSLTGPQNPEVFVRVRTELKNGANWDVEVRNNVVDPNDPNPPALAARPIYVLDGSTFNTGTSGQTRDLTATTGWGGASYTGTRAAAPFSILDSIYEGMLLIRGEDATATFAPLDAFWSPDNSTTQGSGTFDQRADSGEIGTSFYTQNMLFLLGNDGDDAEEFDDHVIVHEWGHYFEDNFSRSDSIGGAHGVGDQLDMRVAFGEGFATALAGIALNDPQYCDTLWFGGVLTGFEIDIENDREQPVGWYNEISMLALIYDLWDTANDGADTSSIGLGPIYDTMIGSQATGGAFTSIFTFATYLKQQGTGQDAFIDALLTDHDVNPSGIDIYGSTELNDGPGTPDDVLPVYTEITLGNTQQICVNNQFDSGRDGNKLSEHRYLRFDLAVPSQLTFTMDTVNPPSTPSPGFDCNTAPETDPEIHQHSDPDFLVWRDGQLWVVGFSCEPNSEIAMTSGLLQAGTYVIDINEFRHEDEQTVNPFPGQVCFDFTVSL